MRRRLVTLVLVLVTIGCSIAPQRPVARTISVSQRDVEAVVGHCGVERWAVKTLSDARAGQVSMEPKIVDVLDLRALAAPQTITGATMRLDAETVTYAVTAHLIAAKIEADSDIHLVIADTRNDSATMIVEFPDPSCVATNRPEIGAARAAFLGACGPVDAQRWKTLDGDATITGVLFFDEPHGQTGVAPNAAELHPVVAFAGVCQ